jgi:hypothetical protein
MHGASLAPAQAVTAPKQLGQHRSKLGALGDGVAMPAVVAHDIVMLGEVQTDTRGDRLLPDGQVNGAGDLAGLRSFLGGLFERTNPQHRTEMHA